MSANALPPISEAAFQRQVIQLAKLLGWRTYHTLDSRGSSAGFPDLVLARERDGRVIFAELKSDAGRVRKEQSEWLAALGAVKSEAVGVYLWRPADLDEIAGVLR